jgi:hypothetical protein
MKELEIFSPERASMVMMYFGTYITDLQSVYTTNESTLLSDKRLHTFPSLNNVKS